jgi:hypothetical protein
MIAWRTSAHGTQGPRLSGSAPTSVDGPPAYRRDRSPAPLAERSASAHHGVTTGATAPLRPRQVASSPESRHVPAGLGEDDEHAGIARQQEAVPAQRPDDGGLSRSLATSAA